MARTISRDKAQRSSEPDLDQSWMKYRECEICLMRYVGNNNRDHKTRIKQWHGIEVCAYCRWYIIPRLNRLEEMGIITIVKEFRDNKKASQPGSSES